MGIPQVSGGISYSWEMPYTLRSMNVTGLSSAATRRSAPLQAVPTQSCGLEQHPSQRIQPYTCFGQIPGCATGLSLSRFVGAFPLRSGKRSGSGAVNMVLIRR